jgi:1-acyl-sn-glycerol-3-phosphate acyltransferase
MIKRTLKYLWYFICCWPCRFFCLLMFQTRAYNHNKIPRKGGFLLLCNHQSFLDPMLTAIPVTRQCCFAARDTLFKPSALAWLIRSFNAIPIKRDRANLTAMRLCIDRLKAGYGLILYPEATRTKDGRIAEIKPGFGLIAKRANVPVIPAVIDGAFECWPRHKKFFSAGKVFVAYGKSIPPEKIAELGDKQFAKLLTKILREMQTELRLRVGREPFNYQDIEK